MQDVPVQLGRYVLDALGISVTLTPWENTGRVPFFLQDRYRFFEGRLMGLRCLFMADKDEREESPATIRKHIKQVRGKWRDSVVYVRERITAYNRKRLIEHKVPFVVPGNQMYLPMLGIDLREHFRKRREEKSGLPPAAQAVLIHALLRSAEDLSPTALAEGLGYSVMTMSRALDELEVAGLGQSITLGRQRRLRLAKPKLAVWEKAQPVLRNPVKSLRSIPLAPDDREPPGLRSNLTALADYSMLAEPEIVTVAFSREGWKSFRKKHAVASPLPGEPGSATVEVWAYAPTLFASDDRVDRLSLYLSLRDTQDERVQAALDQMLEEVAW
jgi:DNA-binding MarR family transcriptional regulator